MSAGGKKTGNPGSSAKSVADEKVQRRAEALRANLRRRKVQQRDRAGTEKTSTDESEQIR